MTKQRNPAIRRITRWVDRIHPLSGAYLVGVVWLLVSAPDNWVRFTYLGSMATGLLTAAIVVRWKQRRNPVVTPVVQLTGSAVEDEYLRRIAELERQNRSLEHTVRVQSGLLSRAAHPSRIQP